MKIVIINNLYKPFARGGAERVTETIVSGMIEAGHSVIIVSSRPYASQPGIPGHIYWPGVYYDLANIPLFLRLFWHFFDIFNFFNYFRLNRLLKKEKPDMVITNNLKGLGLFLARSIKQSKIKHVHILHDVQLVYPSGLLMYGHEKVLDSFPARAYRLAASAVIGSPDLVVSPSRWLLGLHESRGFFRRSKKMVMPNPIVSEITERENFRKERFRFLFVGQVAEHKGVGMLIEASRNLWRDGRDFELVIIGDGPLLARLQAETGDDKSITFLGRKDKIEVREEMMRADCLVMPSLCYENSPTVLYEASAVSLPTIVSDIGGAGELAEIFGGIRFQPESSGVLAGEMARALDDRGNQVQADPLPVDVFENMSVKSYISRLLEISDRI